MADPVLLRTPAEDALLRRFSDREVVQTGPVEDMRVRAFEDFSARGLPHRRVEEWKYTDLRTLLRTVPPVSAPADRGRLQAARHQLGGLDVRRLVVANGRFQPGLSDTAGVEEGLTIRPLDTLLTGSEAAALPALGAAAAANVGVSLNTAFVQGGVIVDVVPGAIIERPIEIVYLAEGDEAQASTARSIVRVGEGAALTVYETFAAIGDAGHHTNALLQLEIADTAQVRVARIQAEPESAFHLGTVNVRLGEAAKLDLFSAVMGGAITRVQAFVRFTGANAEAALRGITLLNGRRHADTTLVVEHDAPGCTSRELFKAVVDDEARSIFQGKIVVPSHAQKTDGKMMTQALLLGEGAEADAKPELEIFADDVVCGHGATCGAIDEDLLFYLRARGIAKDEAEAMLIVAFLAEATEEAGDEALGAVLLKQAEAWLRARRAAS